MLNIYWEKSKSQNIELIYLKIRLQVNFSGPPTHAYINEYSNYLLQHKNQRIWSKTLSGFNIFILKGIMKILKLFVE